jgi:hypothetical protein
MYLSYFSRSKDDTKQKLKEITSMRMQLDRNLEELNEYRRKLDLNARDHKRLQDDLLTVTRENQVRLLFRYMYTPLPYISRRFIKN